MINKNEQYLLDEISRHSWSIKKLDDLVFFPRFIQLETIKRCNARCVMCGIEGWERENDYMNDELYEKIAEELVRYRNLIERVSLFIGGEPLMDKKIASRIEKLVRGGIKNVYITTNASLLSENRASELLESGLSQIDFSFDSLRKDIYEKIRVNLNFEEVLGNILRFIKMRNDGNYKTRIRIRTVEMLCNSNEMGEIEKFWREKLDHNKGDTLYARKMNTNVVYEGAKQETNRFIGFDRYHKEAIVRNDLPCQSLWTTMAILSDGRVGVCCVDMGKNIVIGDIRKQTLKEVWFESQILKEMRKINLISGRGGIGICKNCSAWI